MLKRKLLRKLPELTANSSPLYQKKLRSSAAPNKNGSSSLPTAVPNSQNLKISELFTTPLWKRFYDLECGLNAELQLVKPPQELTNIYNPVEYAADLHCAYLQHYLGNRTKRLMFVGMNPGANGMGQTGVPFGNISTVRDVMQLRGSVHQPPNLHKKRPVQGFGCNIEEPSGVRLWQLLSRLAGGSLDIFAEQCFVHNFCPLIFFDSRGRNITPSELKGDYKIIIRDRCLAVLDDQIDLVKAEIVVAVGDYVHNCLKHSRYYGKMRFLKLAHPSPRSLNNHNWPEKAEKMLQANNLLNYLRNK